MVNRTMSKDKGDRVVAVAGEVLSYWHDENNHELSDLRLHEARFEAATTPTTLAAYLPTTALNLPSPHLACNHRR